MPFKTVQLGPVSFSSGATIIGANGLCDDAEAIVLWANTATTTPIGIQVELTDTGTSFVPLGIGNFTSSAAAITLPMIVTSSVAQHIFPCAFTQIRFVSTGAVASGTSVSIAKKILV